MSLELLEERLGELKGAGERASEEAQRSRNRERLFAVLRPRESDAGSGDSVECLCVGSRVAFGCGRFKEARRLAATAHLREAGSSEVLMACATLYGPSLQPSAANPKENRGKSVQFVQQLLSDFRKCGVCLLFAARCFEAMGRGAECRKCLRKGLRKAKDFPLLRECVVDCLTEACLRQYALLDDSQNAAIFQVLCEVLSLKGAKLGAAKAEASDELVQRAEFIAAESCGSLRFQHLALVNSQLGKLVPVSSGTLKAAVAFFESGQRLPEGVAFVSRLMQQHCDEALLRARARLHRAAGDHRAAESDLAAATRMADSCAPKRKKGGCRVALRMKKLHVDCGMDAAADQCRHYSLPQSDETHSAALSDADSDKSALHSPVLSKAQSADLNSPALSETPSLGSVCISPMRSADRIRAAESVPLRAFYEKLPRGEVIDELLHARAEMHKFSAKIGELQAEVSGLQTAVSQRNAAILELKMEESDLRQSLERMQRPKLLLAKELVKAMDADSGEQTEHCHECWKRALSALLFAAGFALLCALTAANARGAEQSEYLTEDL